MRWGLVAGAAALACSTGAAHAAGPGETTLVGGLPLPAGAVAGGPSGQAAGEAARTSVSQDGRYVAFVSDADALAPGAGLDVTNVYRKDRVTGEVVLVSRATGATGPVADTWGTDPVISDDGARVAWITRAALDGSDGDGLADVYVRDVETATTFLASPATNSAGVESMDLSGNGGHVAFATAARLAPGIDDNTHADIYVRDLAGATTRLVSWNAARTRAGDRPSDRPSISDDGRWIAFDSEALDLVNPFSPRNIDTVPDVYVRDMNAPGTTHLVSRRAGAVVNEGGSGESDAPHIAGTPANDPAGVHIAFSTRAPNVADGDGSITQSTVLRTLSAARSVLVSVGDGGANANDPAHARGISDDGRRVVFSTKADNLGAPPQTVGSVYVRDLDTARTHRVSAGTQPGPEDVEGAISGDGGTLTWFSRTAETADADPDLAGVYARAFPAGTPQLVSRPAGDAPYVAPALVAHTGDSALRSVSADGRYVVAATVSARVPGAGAQGVQIVRLDTVTGAIEPVSRATGPDGAPAPSDVRQPSISADGARVAFVTDGSLDPADGDTASSVYVRDIPAATTTLVSRADGAGPNADGYAADGAISPDGTHVAFTSDAGNLGAPPGTSRVYVRDLANATTRLASRGPGADGPPADAESPSIAAGGARVAFVSEASLDPADGDAGADVYVRDLTAATTTLVSRRSGPDGVDAATGSANPAISADGRVVGFVARDETLAPEAGPWGGARQVVARDLATYQNTLVSRTPGGAPAELDATQPAVDADGSVIAFTSDATNLLPGRGGAGRRAVFARDLATGELSGPPAFGRTANEPVNGALSPSISGDGQCLAFTAQGHNEATGAAGDLVAAYVYTVSGACPKPADDGGGGGGGGTGGGGDAGGGGGGTGGGGGGTGGGGGESQPGGPTAPRISGASMLRKKLRVAKGATAKVAARARARGRGRGRGTPAGTAFRFTLNARADVTIAFERKAKGRKVGKACRRPSRRLRRRRPCTRWVAVRAGGLVRNGVEAGRQSVAFSGRIGRTALAPGAYRATLRASNAAGRSPAVRLAFTVVRR